MDLHEVYKVYMMGIGGIGMSALARYLKMLGKEVAGFYFVNGRDRIHSKGRGFILADNIIQMRQ